MRFKAKLSKEGITLLFALATNLSKFGELGTVLLDPQYMRISVCSGRVDNVNIYVELSAHELFTEHRVESAHGNAIVFELSLLFLAKALHSGRLSTAGSLKLCKRNNKPHLSLEYFGAQSLLGVDIVHDLPIKLIRVENTEVFFPPQIRTPDICVELSKLKLLKTVVERLSKVNKFAAMSVDGQGRLMLEAQSANALIKTIVSGMAVSLMQDESAAPPSQQEIERINVSVRLNLKKLSLLLDFANIPFDGSSLYIAKNEALILYVQLPMQVGGVTYFMSVLHDEALP